MSPAVGRLGLARRYAALRDGRERGQISMLIVFLFVTVAVLILGGIDLTCAQLARVRLLDAADAAALDAADAVDTKVVYGGGVTDTVPLSDATVWNAASAYLGRRDKPTGVTAWHLVGGTGTPDGRSADVVLSGTVALPVSGIVMDWLGKSVTITVAAHASAPLAN